MGLQGRKTRVLFPILIGWIKGVNPGKSLGHQLAVTEKSRGAGSSDKVHGMHSLLPPLLVPNDACVCG